MSDPTPDHIHAAGEEPAFVPAYADVVPTLEFDEAVPPRPEEEVADVARSVPDPQGHGGTVSEPGTTGGRHSR